MQNYCCVTAAVTDRHSKRLQNRFSLIYFCYSYIKFMLIKTGLLVLVEQSKQMVALRPPPVADKGSNALSEITSNRKHIYVQRIATIFQTGEHGSPLHLNNNFNTNKNSREDIALHFANCLPDIHFQFSIFNF